MAQRDLRRGFTIVELITVVLMVVILVSLLLPAVQSSRERARLIQCRNNLRQLGIALHHYNLAHTVLPPGSVNATEPVLTGQPDYKISWIVQILPYIGQRNLWERIDFIRPERSFDGAVSGQPIRPPQKGTSAQDFSAAEGAAAARQGRSSRSNRTSVRPVGLVCPNVTITILICPSDSYSGPQNTAVSYAGCLGGTKTIIDSNADGLLYLNSSESVRAVPDGTANTLLAGETLIHSGGTAGWTCGDLNTLRSTLKGLGRTFEEDSPDYMPSGSARKPRTRFSSIHPHVVNGLLADGSVRGLSRRIGLQVLQNLGSRNDGRLVSDRDF